MSEETLKVITSNRGKYREYKKRLESESKKIKMMNIEYPEIQTDRLERVVDFALDELSPYAPLIIDDSGLFIDGLNGFPGVYSAYVMETIGCDGILQLMDGVSERDARFECIIGCLIEEKKLFKGTSQGTITHEKRGTKGFGYDPIFKPKDFEKTYAEMTSEKKNQISHRGASMEKLLEFMRSTP